MWAGAHVVLGRFFSSRRSAEKYHQHGLVGILLNGLIGHQVWVTDGLSIVEGSSTSAYSGRQECLVRCQGSSTTVFGTVGTTDVPPGLVRAFPSRCPYVSCLRRLPPGFQSHQSEQPHPLGSSIRSPQVVHCQLRHCPVLPGPSSDMILEGDTEGIKTFHTFEHFISISRMLRGRPPGSGPAGGFLLATAGILDDLLQCVLATTDVCQRKSEVDEKHTRQKTASSTSPTYHPWSQCVRK